MAYIYSGFAGTVHGYDNNTIITVIIITIILLLFVPTGPSMVGKRRRRRRRDFNYDVSAPRSAYKWARIRVTGCTVRETGHRTRECVLVLSLNVSWSRVRGEP